MIISLSVSLSQFRPIHPITSPPWILETGFWNDVGVWRDTSIWMD